MNSKEIRRKYIDFFKNYPGREHTEIPSGSLLPENDPSTLFISAGMQPLVPFLLGEKHPAGSRLVNSQKCIRTGDIDEVGDKIHHTFFEMLGHWSLGDYFKPEAIEMSYKFLTEELGLEKEKLAFSVFEGDANASKDEESIEAWKSLGISAKRIKALNKKENWWEPGGETGPCGPDTEMFYWADSKMPVPEEFDPNNERWVEIGNDVLMQYEKQGEGNYLPAKQKNIDNGTGLERLTAVLNGLDDNYRTDLFWPIIKKIEELSGKNYIDFGRRHVDVSPSGEEETDSGRRHSGMSPSEEDNTVVRSMRIIADHLRAATFIMGDDKGIGPSNVDQGYVVRKLIRRAIRHGKLIGINQEKPWIGDIANVVVNKYWRIYPELRSNFALMIGKIVEEEIKFQKTLEQGLKQFEKMRPRFVPGSEINNSLSSKSGMVEYDLNGDDLFNLYATYGFPIEVSIEEIKKMYKEFNEERGIKIPIVELSKEDEDRILKQFHESLRKHQELSRTAAVGKFKGGLANQSEQTVKLHTVAHLMLAGLRRVLGEQVNQRGSNITEERLRFDFNQAEKMTPEQIKAVEDFVNEKIKADLPVKCEEMSVAEAKTAGATGIFDSKYGDKVKVYTIGEGDNIASKEICGGPHVERTGDLGHFKIIKEQSSSAGIRRIKAILE